jgi:autotransporter-associated beta strand protein
MDHGRDTGDRRQFGRRRGQIELSNSTTLTGPITSLGGQILVSSGDAVLSNDITLEGGGLTVRTFGNNATFSGSLSGVGGLTMDGDGIGTLTLTGNNTYTGETIVNSGRLVVEGRITSPLTLENGAVLDGSGTVGPVTIKSGGSVAPGNSPGLLTAGETRFEGGGAYLLDLRSDGTGAAGTDWDSLAVNTLDISALSEANPFIVRLQTLDASNGLNFLDVWDRNVSHTWNSVLSAVALGGGDFDPRLVEVDTTGFQNPISGTFSVVQDGTNLDLQYRADVVEPGDYNQDGIVDAADYTVWRDTLGQSGTGLAADGNQNDQIDAGDYDVWRAHFGQTVGSGSGASANTTVPEPATLEMLLMGMLVMCSRRRALVP